MNQVWEAFITKHVTFCPLQIPSILFLFSDSKEFLQDTIKNSDYFNEKGSQALCFINDCIWSLLAQVYRTIRTDKNLLDTFRAYSHEISVRLVLHRPEISSVARVCIARFGSSFFHEADLISFQEKNVNLLVLQDVYEVGQVEKLFRFGATGIKVDLQRLEKCNASQDSIKLIQFLIDLKDDELNLYASSLLTNQVQKLDPANTYSQFLSLLHHLDINSKDIKSNIELTCKMFLFQHITKICHVDTLSSYLSVTNKPLSNNDDRILGPATTIGSRKVDASKSKKETFPHNIREIMFSGNTLSGLIYISCSPWSALSIFVFFCSNSWLWKIVHRDVQSTLFFSSST
jgi:hypothetical protein